MSKKEKVRYSPGDVVEYRKQTKTGETWDTCQHNWGPMFGPCLKCSHCGATTILSFGGESKPIFPPIEQEKANATVADVSESISAPGLRGAMRTVRAGS